MERKHVRLAEGLVFLGEKTHTDDVPKAKQCKGKNPVLPQTLLAEGKSAEGKT
jgi:hypothetical protein